MKILRKNDATTTPYQMGRGPLRRIEVNIFPGSRKALYGARRLQRRRQHRLSRAAPTTQTPGINSDDTGNTSKEKGVRGNSENCS